MVVHIPPRMLAKPIGISEPDGDVPVRTATPIRIGNIRTTMGVLLMNALSVAVRISVSSIERIGPLRNDRARIRPTGSSAPVRINPSPTIIRAHTATRALCPNPRKKSLGCTRCPSSSKGNRVNPTVSTTSTSRLVVSSGMLSRVNSTRATKIRIITAMAWVFGSASSSINRRSLTDTSARSECRGGFPSTLLHNQAA